MNKRNGCIAFHRILTAALAISLYLLPVTFAFHAMVGKAYAANNSFVYNPKSLQWTAINADGKVVRTGRGSGGRAYCPDIHRSCRTPTGTYHIIGKGGAGCRSSRYPVGRGGAPMPYCMFFSKYYAIHGSYDVPNRNASHGCIRVTPSDAHWLHSNFIREGTTVVVKPY
jgi:lipoprotein-anchoring transpeptidase ErfK/SrfK